LEYKVCVRGVVFDEATEIERERESVGRYLGLTVEKERCW
jgi:hypothetical protein